MLMFEKQDYMIKFDLKSGYHHLDIFEAHQTYLAVLRTAIDWSPRYFVFSVLLFWVSHCLLYLHKIVEYWRGQGLTAILYPG